MAKNIQISEQAHAKIITAQAKIALKTGKKPTLSQTIDKLLKVTSN